MKAHNILGSTRPSMGRCAGVRAFATRTAARLAAAGGNGMYWGQCTNPSKRFGRLAHVEDPTTPGEGDAQA